MADDPSPKKISDPREMYSALRAMMLKNARPKTISAPGSPKTPWGVLMDWGVRNGTATVMSMSDGSASVYLSSGGGFIGGQNIEPVRLAAQRAVAEAQSVQLPEQAVKDFPLPDTNGAIFYFLTDAGVFALRASVSELSSGSHPLRKLGDAMQAVITQFRLKYPKPVSAKSVKKPN
jgi:hypothetical protein